MARSLRRPGDRPAVRAAHAHDILLPREVIVEIALRVADAQQQETVAYALRHGLVEPPQASSRRTPRPG